MPGRAKQRELLSEVAVEEGRQNRPRGKTQVSTKMKEGYEGCFLLPADEVHGLETFRVVAGLSGSAEGYKEAGSRDKRERFR